MNNSKPKGKMPRISYRSEAITAIAVWLNSHDLKSIGNEAALRIIDEAKPFEIPNTFQRRIWKEETESAIYLWPRESSYLEWRNKQKLPGLKQKLANRV